MNDCVRRRIERQRANEAVVTCAFLSVRLAAPELSTTALNFATHLRVDRPGPSRGDDDGPSRTLWVTRLNEGRPVNLDTADRVLRFIGDAPMGSMVRREVEAFLSTTGKRSFTPGRKADEDPSFVTRLRRGSSPRLETLPKVRAWMRETASGAKRTAIARLIADGGEAALSYLRIARCSPRWLMFRYI